VSPATNLLTACSLVEEMTNEHLVQQVRCMVVFAANGLIDQSVFVVKTDLDYSGEL
jgi:hypothetical protein